MSEKEPTFSTAGAVALGVWCVAILVFQGTLMFVVPHYERTFAELGIALPAVTGLVLRAAQFFRSFFCFTAPVTGLVIVGSIVAFLKARNQARAGRVFGVLAAVAVLACLGAWLSVTVPISKISEGVEREGPAPPEPK